MTVFEDNFYREEVRRCYKEIEELTETTRRLRDQNKALILTLMDKTWVDNMKELAVRKNYRRFNHR